MGLGPPAVVGLERALAHSWAPGPEGVGGACLSASDDSARRAQAPGAEVGLAAAAIVVKTGQRYGRPLPPVKRGPGAERDERDDRDGPVIAMIGVGASETGHPRRSGAVGRVDTPHDRGPIVPTGEKNLRRVVDNGLLRHRRVVNVSPVAQPQFPRSTSPVALAVRQTGPLSDGCWTAHRPGGPGAPDKTGQPMYTGCGRPCGRQTTGVFGHRGIPPVALSQGSPIKGAPGGALRAEPDTRGMTG